MRLAALHKGVGLVGFRFRHMHSPVRDVSSRSTTSAWVRSADCRARSTFYAGCLDLAPERARSCRNAITMASVMVDEIRLRVHAARSTDSHRVHRRLR